MLFKTLAGIGLFAAAGAAVGYSKILCAGGECQITGTPYGGAIFGGLFGLAVMSSIGGQPINTRSIDPADPQPGEPAEPKDEQD